MGILRYRRPRLHRHTTVRVTGPDGVTWEGEGEGLAAAVRDLGRQHGRQEPAPDQGEARWRSTRKGRAYLAAQEAGR